MPAKDIFHDVVKKALVQDNWVITHDPLTLDLRDRQLHIDLGAERLIGAQKENQQIAVEIKSFVSSSSVFQFHLALGQFLNYRIVLSLKQPQIVLYLAVPLSIYDDFFCEELPQLSIKEYEVKLLVFDPNQEVIVQWIN
ncbi:MULTISPECIES: element excision factor XisH family protein [unclassified Moorena]|uniref:element excision factor XisH family protein n=1 Tax=unclassified Moorena TaxID=2683338 RepID=UPI0013FC97ED|nr:MULTISPECIES: element excision factor XisH family protein [unclassified Moorena]NEP22591.1 fatty-acid oxidation protein subunit alpha [Moorena sp. SIO3I6]NEQ58166.1 fatty-acid oxidation protein subunit alpha [Moorena sp. SIO4A1]